MTTAAQTISPNSTVLIVEDHPLFCDALSMTLNDCLSISDIKTASCMADALDLLKAGASPDIIILDLNLPDVSGMDGLLRLKSAMPGTPVVVVSSLSDNKIVTSVIQSGAAGFVSKDSPREVIATALQTVWNGDLFTPSDYVAPSGETDELNETQRFITRLSELTPQQGRILQYICEGKLNKQIAYDLSIAEATVKAHVTAILRKLGVQSRTQAVLVAQKTQFASILHEDPIEH